MNQRQEIDAEIAVVRELLGEVAQRLSRSRLATVDELLRNDEPDEALLIIAWELKSHWGELSEDTVRRFREATADWEDLPPTFPSAGRVDKSDP